MWSKLSKQLFLLDIPYKNSRLVAHLYTSQVNWSVLLKPIASHLSCCQVISIRWECQAADGFRTITGWRRFLLIRRYVLWCGQYFAIVVVSSSQWCDQGHGGGLIQIAAADNVGAVCRRWLDDSWRIQKCYLFVSFVVVNNNNCSRRISNQVICCC